MAPSAKVGTPKLTIPEHSETKKKDNNVESKSKETNEDDKQRLPSFKDKLYSWRWRISAILWLGNFVTMALRGCMSMALVCMSGPGNSPEIVSNMTMVIVNGSGAYYNITPKAPTGPVYEFSFDRSTRGLILSGTLYSGLFAPFLGGVLTQKFGAKRFIFYSMMGAGVCCILIPPLTRTHVYFTIGLRFLVGLCTVGNMAAFQDIWSTWSPQLERVSMVAFSVSGVNFASTLIALICGFICSIDIDNGWPFIFYIFGSICVLWCFLWLVFVSNSPEEHSLITEEEKVHIIANRLGMSGKQKRRTPWQKILTSRPVWGFILTQACNVWCATTLFMYLPVYYSSILEFSIEYTGALLSIPFMFRFIGTLFWGFLSDQLLQNTKLNVSKIRKTVQSIGFLGAALAAAFVTFIPTSHRGWVVVACVILMFFQSASMASSALTPLDIAPRYAGVITGVMICISTNMGIISPMVTSEITFGGSREFEWRIVFFILTGFYILGTLTFGCFVVNSELQPWAVEADDDDPKVAKYDEKASETGIDNFTFEIETPKTENGDVTPGLTPRLGLTRRTNSSKSNTGSQSRTPIEMSIVQTSELGTPTMVMKFPGRRTVSKCLCSPKSPPNSPFSKDSDKPFQFNAEENKDENKQAPANGNVLDINTAIVPTD